MSATATKGTASGRSRSKPGGSTTKGTKTSAKTSGPRRKRKRRLYRCFSDRQHLRPLSVKSAFPASMHGAVTKGNRAKRVEDRNPPSFDVRLRTREEMR
jgi:hypothetical protein